MTTAPVSPSRIMEVGMAFWPSKVLLSAIELRLFSELGSRAMMVTATIACAATAKTDRANSTSAGPCHVSVPAFSRRWRSSWLFAPIPK